MARASGASTRRLRRGRRIAPRLALGRRRPPAGARRTSSSAGRRTRPPGSLSGRSGGPGSRRAPRGRRRSAASGSSLVSGVVGVVRRAHLAACRRGRRPATPSPSRSGRRPRRRTSASAPSGRRTRRRWPPASSPCGGSALGVIATQKKAWFQAWAALLNSFLLPDALRPRITSSRLPAASTASFSSSLMVFDVGRVVLVVVEVQRLVGDHRLERVIGVGKVGQFEHKGAPVWRLGNSPPVRWVHRA